MFGWMIRAGLVDDTLRHAITKLSHLHFPATAASADRILKLGEEPATVHTLGAPGIDGIADEAGEVGVDGPFTLLVHHPETTDADGATSTEDVERAFTIAFPVEREGRARIRMGDRDHRADMASGGVL